MCELKANKHRVWNVSMKKDGCCDALKCINGWMSFDVRTSHIQHGDMMPLTRTIKQRLRWRWLWKHACLFQWFVIISALGNVHRLRCLFHMLMRTHYHQIMANIVEWIKGIEKGKKKWTSTTQMRQIRTIQVVIAHLFTVYGWNPILRPQTQRHAMLHQNTFI